MLIRLLALLALFWTGKHIISQISSMVNPQRRSHESSSHDGEADEMVKDPICQTYVPKSLAIRKTRAGVDQYFCSEECAAKFTEQAQSESS
ncbi:hypothetical protein CSB45_04580 [candidate division KSB3 bacterium]|uniref:TRASH domain-containing protein n=1 Tax=candidate division KSB3 bacterium TaxID=2044937 RepID=A0A2G6E993_9BACT|nr:MAG: hypothetical protein CSB45_04580 [candidate division KSB3 bacterium]PIE30652.1 MAG: hypothetical protein CSA57_03165 [candidate division KSB3 bacterium]